MAMKSAAAALFLAVAAAASRPAWSQEPRSSRGVRLEAVSWQLFASSASRQGAWEDARSVVVRGSKLPGRLRAVATLDNAASRAMLGLVLRYVVSMRYDAPAAGTENIPFFMDERRVPMVKAGESLRLSLEVPNLASNLRESLGSNLPLPISVRIKVVLKPRGDLVETLQAVSGDLRLRYENR
jgi:hypothetical protein